MKVSLPELQRAGETPSGNRNVIGPTVPMCSEPLKPGMSTFTPGEKSRIMIILVEDTLRTGTLIQNDSLLKRFAFDSDGFRSIAH